MGVGVGADDEKPWKPSLWCMSKPAALTDASPQNSTA